MSAYEPDYEAAGAALAAPRPDFEEDMYASLSNPGRVVDFARRNEEDKQESSLTWGESLDAAWTGAVHGVATYAPETFYRAFRTLGRFFGSTDLEQWAEGQINEELAIREADEWYRPDPKWMETEWGRSLYDGFSSFTAGTATILPGAAVGAAAAVAAPVVSTVAGGTMLGTAFLAGAGGGGLLAGAAEYDSFMDEAYKEISAVDPTVTKEMVYNEQYWKAVLSGFAEGGMSALGDAVGGKMAKLLGKPAAAAATSVVTRLIKNLTSHMAIEVGEEAATAYFQDKARAMAGLDSAGSWEAIKQVLGPTLVAGGLGGLQNTALGHFQERAALKDAAATAGANDATDAVKILIERHNNARQREALSDHAMAYMQGLKKDGAEGAFETALVADKLANRHAAETGSNPAEYMAAKHEGLDVLAKAASDKEQTFDGVVGAGLPFLWNSLAPDLKMAVEENYASSGREMTQQTLAADFASWVKAGGKASADAPMTDAAAAGFATMQGVLADSVEALQSNSRVHVSQDTLAALDDALTGTAKRTMALPPAVVRDNAGMNAVLERYKDVLSTEELTAAQTAELLHEAAGTVNVDVLSDGSPSDVAGMYAQYARALEPVLSRLRKNKATRPDASVDAATQAMLADNPGIAEVLDVFDAGLGYDAKVREVELILTAADANMKQMAERALLTGAPADILQARVMAERVVAMQKISKGIGTEQGRAFRMRRFNKKDPRFAEQVMAGLAAYGRDGGNEAFLMALVNAKDREGRMKIADIPAGRRTLDAVVEYVTSGMLFGPSTHVVNAMSNSVQIVNELVTRAYARLTNAPVQGGVAPGEVQACILGLWKGIFRIRDTWSAHRAEYGPGAGGVARAALGMNNMWTSMDDSSALADAGSMNRAISGENAREVFGAVKRYFGMSAEHGMVSNGLSTAIEYLGRLLHLPFDALQHSDQVFKTLAYSMELNAQIHRAAGGDAKVAAAMHKAPPKDLQGKAQAFARRVTFQDDLGRVGSSINAIRSEMPLTRLLLPFLKTPINVYKEGARMTPFLNKVFKDIRADLNSNDPATRQLSEAKLMVGNILWGSAMVAAGMGFLTGPGPEDKDERAKWLATGAKPNALRIGDEYYAIDRLDPLAAVFNSAAFLVEVKDHIQADDLETAMMMGMGQSLRLLTNRTYVDSFAEAMRMMTDFERTAGSLRRRVGGMLVPASALMRTVNRSDPFQREVDGFWDAIKQNIPGMSASLPVRRDFLGSPVKSNNYAGNQYLSPFQVGRDNHDPIYKEINRLHRAGLSAASMPSRIIQQNNLRHKMTGEQYSRYLDLYSSVRLADGNTNREALTELLSSPQYAEMTDDERARKIKALLTRYRKAARDELLGTDKQIQRSFAVKARGMEYLLGK